MTLITLHYPTLQLQLQLQLRAQVQVQLHYITVHHTTLNTLHYTLLRDTTLHYTSLHSTTTTTSTTTILLSITRATQAISTTPHPNSLYATLNYTTTALHYTTLHYTTLNCTTLHYTYNYNHNYKYATLHYTTLDSTPRHYPTLHYTGPLHLYNSRIQLQTHYTNYTTPQLQLQYITTTTAAALHHTTSSSCGWGDHCNHCNHSKKHNSNHLSVHQWIRSAIRESQQPTSPIGFLCWNFRHRLVQYYWCNTIQYNITKCHKSRYTIHHGGGIPHFQSTATFSDSTPYSNSASVWSVRSFIEAAPADKPSSMRPDTSASLVADVWDI